MKLLLVAPEFPPAVGGMEAHAWHAASHLVGRGHRVIVATRRAYRGEPYDLSARVEPILGRRFLPDLWRLWRLARAEAPDAILLLNAGYAALGRLVACPVVCRTVGNDVYNAWIGPHLPLRALFWRGRHGIARWWRRRDQRLRNACILWGLRSCHEILANSEFTAQALVRLGLTHPRLSVLSGGVDVSLFRPSPPRAATTADDGRFALLTVANLSAKKGIDTGLVALHRLVYRYPRLEYRIAGTGDDQERLATLARTLGIDQHVRFLGRRSAAEVAALLHDTDVYVHSSRTVWDPVTGCPDIETMGRAVCEANAAGVPVAVTDSGGLPHIVRHDVNGLVVPESDPEALANAIDLLLQTPALRQRLAAAGVDLARSTFSWSIVTDRTEQALRRACTPPRGPAGAPKTLENAA